MTVTARRSRKVVFKKTGPWEDVVSDFVEWILKQKTEDLKETEVQETPRGGGE
jgi:hypothetical protein